mgnify:FL=1
MDMTDYLITIGDYIRMTRKSLRITQAQLGEHLEVARTTVVAIESGKRKLNMLEMEKLRSLGFTNIGNINYITNIDRDDYIGHITLSPEEVDLIVAYRHNDYETITRIYLNKLRESAE